ncbi:MAG: MraY family glycosyltransferase, partial [Patescibacteria group bacterium]|nr:MraY family glycosyltransferase [Patescibacteria group bacterium]
GGGLAIYAGFLLGLLFFNPVLSKEIIGYLLGSFIIILLGASDDKLGLRATPKFFVQSVAAAIAIYFGVVINMDQILVGHLADYDFLSIPLTFLWLIGVTNAVNIIDGLDGLAAGVSTIAAFAISAVAFLNGEFLIGPLALIVGFSALGFLPHNFKSRIFMGDSGSLFLGFSLASLSIMGSLKLTAAFSLLVPIMILLVPIFDTLFAILRRIIKRQSIFEGDRRHFHHRLLDLGFSSRQAVYFIYFLSIVFAGLAIYSSFVRNRDGYIAFGVSLIVLFVATSIIVFLHQKKENQAN